MQPLQCRCYLRRKARRAGSGGFDRGSVVHGVKVVGGSVFNCNTQSFLSGQDRRVVRAGVTLKGLLHSPVRGLYQRPFSGRAPWFVSGTPSSKHIKSYSQSHSQGMLAFPGAMVVVELLVPNNSILPDKHGLVIRTDVVPSPERIDCWSCAMPREIRDRTVPSGTSRISAISLYEWSSI